MYEVVLYWCFLFSASPPFSFPTEYNFLALQNTDSAVLLFKVAHSFSRARRFSWDRAILYRGARGNCRQTLQMIFRTRCLHRAAGIYSLSSVSVNHTRVYTCGAERECSAAVPASHIVTENVLLVCVRGGLYDTMF